MIACACAFDFTTADDFTTDHFYIPVHDHAFRDVMEAILERQPRRCSHWCFHRGLTYAVDLSHRYMLWVPLGRFCKGSMAGEAFQISRFDDGLETHLSGW